MSQMNATINIKRVENIETSCEGQKKRPCSDIERAPVEDTPCKKDIYDRSAECLWRDGETEI